MNFSIVYKCVLILGLLLGCNVSASAQDANMERSKRVYELFVADQGDSIYAMFSEPLQKKLSPAVFKDMFKSLEKQFGKLQSQGEWDKDSAEGISIYHRDLKFERYELRLMLSYEADGSLNMVRLIPVPAPSTAEPVKFDEETMQEREITVGVDDYKLPGTLTFPKGNKKSPVVILVHGSGPNDRDETAGPNKPFRDLAWGLAGRGIATVRYDKRTMVYGSDSAPGGRENIDFDTETVDDAIAAAIWAKTQPEIFADSIYVLGHSQGGLLAPRIAERTEGLAGIIIVAGLARAYEDAFIEQITYISSLTDSSNSSAQKQLADIKRQVDNVKKLGTPEFNDTIPLPLGSPRHYWEFANKYKPVEVAVKLTLPMLILQGERDYQVTMEDFGLWRLGLIKKKNAFFKSYPKLNHLLQEGSGKSTPFEYYRVSPVAGYVMDDITEFIRTGRLE